MGSKLRNLFSGKGRRPEISPRAQASLERQQVAERHPSFRPTPAWIRLTDEPVPEQLHRRFPELQPLPERVRRAIMQDVWHLDLPWWKREFRTIAGLACGLLVLLWQIRIGFVWLEAGGFAIIFFIGLIYVACYLGRLMQVPLMRPYILRRLPSACRHCGYDLRLIESGRCPECGLAVDREPR